MMTKRAKARFFVLVCSFRLLGAEWGPGGLA